MRRALCASILASVVVALALVIFTAPLGARGQVIDRNWKPAGSMPRMADGKPDLSGVWWQGRDLNVGGFLGEARDGEYPVPAPGQSFASLYQPWAMAKLRTLGDKDDPALRCIPSVDGPQNSNIFQLVHTPTLLVHLQETYHGFRLIPTRPGVAHSTDAPPSLWGDSVGRWEGDTLVVDVTNFSDRNWIVAEGNISFHSDALHIVERYTRTAANALEIEKTYDDPKVLTRPFVQRKRTYALAPMPQIMEVMCENTDTAALMDAAAKNNYGRK